ncbi:uncharacterized protein LOC135496646 isoform X2 [Lineus longissimus]|uniref:uncharacterized protein LOC135496646 isoform X2 n=1 Tax=Lineus longissimus TaxID=88925 RepID=UPI00315CB05F
MADTGTGHIEHGETPPTCETCESDSEIASVAESLELGDADSDTTTQSSQSIQDAPKKSKKKSAKKTSSSTKKKKVKKKKDSSFVVDFSSTQDSKSSKDNLQQAFQKYRKSKQSEWKEQMKLREIQMKKRTNPECMEELRKKFLERAKKYFGVPYKRKYWPKDAPEYKSPIFLDCCGLVRRIMWDLKFDFGFKIGPWNQAYMYDTLPITVRKEEDMKPGDLVFISAIYNNPKAKKQRHNMVHVEIWLGDGPKTIGARWQKGKVQVFDHYKFNATSYHSPKYTLKSIDTWLMGICQSYCDVHPWHRKGKMYAPSTRSVFAKRDDSDMQQAQDDDCVDANDTDDELIMTPDDPEELRKKLRDCLLEGEIENTPEMQDMQEEQEQDLGEEIEDQQMNIENFGANVASAGLGKNLRNGTRSIGAVKLSSSPQHAKFLGSTTGDSMETAANAVDVMSKGRSKDDGGNNKNFIKKQDKPSPQKQDKQSTDSGGPIKLKMTTSPPLQPVGKGPDKESQRRVPVSAQAVQKSAPAGTSRSQPGAPAHGSVSNNTSSNPQKSAPASQRRGPETKSVTTLPKPQLPSSLKTDNSKLANAPSVKSQHNNGKVPTKVDPKTLAKTEPVKQISPGIKQTKSDSNTKSDSSFNASQKAAAQSPVKSAPVWKSSPPAAQVSKMSPQVATAKVTSQKQTDASKSTQAPGGPTQGQTSSGTNSPKRTMSVVSPPFKNAQGQAQSNMPRVPQKTRSPSPKAEWKPPGATGNRRSSDAGASTTNRRLSESGASKSSPPRPKQQDDTDKKQEKRESIKSPNNSQEKTDTAADASLKKPKRLPPPTVSLANNQTPLFYIGGFNGTALVENVLTNLGWKRTTEKSCENFRLKWTECKSQINYTIFKEGEQMVNHVPNCTLLTNKLGLMNSLREYERVTMTMKKVRQPRFKMTDIIPETYNLDERNDREAFYETYQEGEMWICKPTGLNQGKGIFLVRELEDVTKFFREREEKFANSKRSQRPMPRIIQRYLKDPLLIRGCKFDIRAYMLIASTVPFIVLYHKGYIRLSCHKYCKDSTDLTTHLTNQFIQKKDPLYKDVKEDTVINMAQFNDYINEKHMEQKGLEKDWVKNTCTKQMQRIMLHLFNSVRHKLTAKVGFFELYGLDFMIDDAMKVWLIEVNINPALHIGTEILKETLPPMVEESLAISIEVFEKVRKSQAIYPIRAIKNFTYLYCGVDRRSSKQRESETQGRGSPQRARSASPIKDEWVPRGRSNSNSSPYMQPLNLPKINAKYKTSDITASANGVRTSIAVTPTTSATEPVKLKMTHSDEALASGYKTEVKVGPPNRGN